MADEVREAPRDLSGELYDIQAVPGQAWEALFLCVQEPTAAALSGWLARHMGAGYTLTGATITNAGGWLALTVKGYWNSYTGLVGDAWDNMKWDLEQLTGQWYPVGYRSGGVAAGEAQPGVLSQVQGVLRLLLYLLLAWVAYRLYRDWR